MNLQGFEDYLSEKGSDQKHQEIKAIPKAYNRDTSKPSDTNIAFVVVTQPHLEAWLPVDTGWFQLGQENSSNYREPKQQVK